MIVTRKTWFLFMTMEYALPLMNGSEPLILYNIIYIYIFYNIFNILFTYVYIYFIYIYIYIIYFIQSRCSLEVRLDEDTVPDFKTSFQFGIRLCSMGNP